MGGGEGGNLDSRLTLCPGVWWRRFMLRREMHYTNTFKQFQRSPFSKQASQYLIIEHIQQYYSMSNSRKLGPNFV